MLVPLVPSILHAETPSCAFQLLLPETPWREVAGELDSPLNTAGNQACFLFCSHSQKSANLTLQHLLMLHGSQSLQRCRTNVLLCWSQDRQ